MCCKECETISNMYAFLFARFIENTSRVIVTMYFPPFWYNFLIAEWKTCFYFLLSFKITLKSHWGFLSSARERKKNFKKSFWFRVGLLIFLIRSFYQAAPGIKSRKIYFNSASTKTYPPLLLTKPCCMCRTCSLVLERKELMKKGKLQDYRYWKWNICLEYFWPMLINLAKERNLTFEQKWFVGFAEIDLECLLANWILKGQFKALIFSS